MIRLRKRIFSLLLALVMVFGMMPGVTIEAFAADATADVTTEEITLGDFAVAEVGKKALVSSDVLLSQKTLIAVPYCGAELHIHVNDGYQVRIHSGDNNNNIDQVSDWLNNGDSYTLPQSSIYMRVSIQRTDGGVITAEELESAGAVVSYESSSDIVTDNADAAQILKNTDLPVLLHLSDIHGDTIRAERAASFADYVGADALLASGDLTAYEPDDWGSALFDAMGNYPDVNFIYGIGNHDAKVSASSYQEKIYQSYYAENPLTPDGETYYYQDLDNQKLRIISVNQQEGASTTTRGGTCYSQEQVDWLVEALQTTPAGYGVVLMYHSPETAIANAMDSDYTEFFQTDNRYDNSTNNYSGYTGTFLMDLVDAFMLRENFSWNYSEKNGASPVELNADFTGVADGVEFIAHVTGHVHSDSVTYLPGTACKQLLLGVTCTNSMYGEPGGYYGLADYSDLNRVGNTASQDAFNAYVIDRENKTVRILRVGAQETVSGAIRDDMTIPYSVPFAEGEYLFDTEGMIKLDLDDVEWVNYGIQADGTDSTYMSGVRWSPNLVFDVPYEGVTIYIKINAPYEMGIRSGETDTTMSTNYYWLNNKQLTTGDKNRGYVYTIPKGHTKFVLSVANVDRDGDNNVISTTNTNLLNSLELKAAGLEIWYVPNHTHTYTPTVTAPTCTEQGYTTYACECGDSYVADYVDASGHTYENGTCTGCGAEHPNLANYEDKVISILGDSISTFAGYIPTADGFNLEHYARYPQDNLFTDVEHTWWMQVLTALDAKLGINESWRSTEVGNIYDVEVNSGYEGTKACMASLTRIQNLGSNGTPDVILFYGGTNDITQRRTVGTFDPATAPTEVDLTAVKWDTVAEAYVAAIMRMQYYYPDAQIIAMLPTFTYKNTDAVIEEYNSVFAAICEHYGVTYIDLRDCGITTSDLPDGTHPDETGMDYITAAVLDILLIDCEVEAGEHTVHSVTHNLTGAESSLSYYKGVSHGKSFVTAISGEELTVTVTMGGVDITADCYANSVVSIESVTGDVVITATGKEKTVYDDHLQQLPDDLCSGLNLWTALEPENSYYTTTGWGNLSTGQVWSITIPVTAGDRIYANSFEKNGSNGNNYSSTSGIRVTYFDVEGVYKSLSPDEVYAEFAANGYLTIPENVVAVCVPMWTNTDESVVYILSAEHSYENGLCSGCGVEDPDFYIPGDINGDGQVNNKDLTRLFQYLSDYDVEVVEAALDINGDGAVNNKDLTRLFQYLSDYPVEIC